MRVEISRQWFCSLTPWIPLCENPYKRTVLPSCSNYQSYWYIPLWHREQHCCCATIPLTYSSSCYLKGQTGHRKEWMSSSVLVSIIDTLITLHWKEMEDKLSFDDKQVPFSIAKMSEKPLSNWISIDFPVSILLLFGRNWIITSFLEINHPPGDYSFLWRKTRLSLFESIGLTIALGSLALFGQHTQSNPWKTQKTPLPEGHYFWLRPQGQLADFPKGRDPVLALLNILSLLLW